MHKATTSAVRFVVMAAAAAIACLAACVSADAQLAVIKDVKNAPPVVHIDPATKPPRLATSALSARCRVRPTPSRL
jgi:hypothetical protein